MIPTLPIIPPSTPSPPLPSPPPQTTNQGSMTIKNMVVINLPNNPLQYPAGLLTCMPWYLGDM